MTLRHHWRRSRLYATKLKALPGSSATRRTSRGIATRNAPRCSAILSTEATSNSVLQLVEAMVDADSAHVVMGNH